MSTAISVLGGVGLFLLGMTVMTNGLKELAGSALRTVLEKAAATSLRGVWWGAVVTLLVQSSSATTMTTIGLVSAGLLTFPQGLGLVLGANVGTTGTAWLVALIGVRISLTAAALPMIFVGALIKLLGRGRVSGAGAALAGFALVLFGLTTLQQGMAGLAETLHPADLAAVVIGPETGLWADIQRVLILVLVGLVMTTLMQSSTAAIAVTISAHFAGAIGLDQACALIIGQNIGTATSSALAAIGASFTAKRLAVAYILFKLIAAIIALALFPLVIPFLVRISNTVDGTTLLAAYHTAYNVVGVLVVLPVIDRFTRLVERMLPARGSPLTRCLDPAALAHPIVAVEAVRRTVARAIATVCGSVETRLAESLGDAVRPKKDAAPVVEAAEVLRQAQTFISDVCGPPESDDDQQRLTSTLHALDYATRLTEIAGEKIELGTANNGPDDARAVQLCADAIRSAASVADEVAIPPAAHVHAESHAPQRSFDALAMEIEETLLRLKYSANALDELQSIHRVSTLRAVANGALTADEAMLRVDTVRRLNMIAHHAWLAVAELVGFDTWHNSALRPNQPRAAE